MRYYERMKKKSDLGYATIRVSKKAYEELVSRALKEERTIIATLNRILGV